MDYSIDSRRTFRERVAVYTLLGGMCLILGLVQTQDSTDTQPSVFTDTMYFPLHYRADNRVYSMKVFVGPTKEPKSLVLSLQWSFSSFDCTRCVVCPADESSFRIDIASCFKEVKGPCNSSTAIDQFYKEPFYVSDEVKTTWVLEYGSDPKQPVRLAHLPQPISSFCRSAPGQEAANSYGTLGLGHSTYGMVDIITEADCFLSKLFEQGLIYRISFTLCLSEDGGYIKFGKRGVSKSARDVVKIPLEKQNHGNHVTVNLKLNTIRIKDKKYFGNETSSVLPVLFDLEEQYITCSDPSIR